MDKEKPRRGSEHDLILRWGMLGVQLIDELRGSDGRRSVLDIAIASQVYLWIDFGFVRRRGSAPRCSCMNAQRDDE